MGGERAYREAQSLDEGYWHEKYTKEQAYLDAEKELDKSNALDKQIMIEHRWKVKLANASYLTGR